MSTVTGLADAAQVEQDERDDRRAGDDELVREHRRQEHAEQRVRAARDGDGDGQHVVDEERGAETTPARAPRSSVATTYPPPPNGNRR